MKYSQTLIDDEYESGNIYVLSKELERISSNIHLNHTSLAATKLTVDLIVTDTIKI